MRSLRQRDSGPAQAREHAGRVEHAKARKGDAETRARRDWLGSCDLGSRLGLLRRRHVGGLIVIIVIIDRHRNGDVGREVLLHVAHDGGNAYKTATLGWASVGRHYWASASQLHDREGLHSEVSHHKERHASCAARKRKRTCCSNCCASAVGS